MNILGTGLSGLVGSRIVICLSPSYTFEHANLETGVDITDQKTITELIITSPALWVFHFAAMTDVDGSEHQKGQGTKSAAWRVNVQATEYIIDACRRSGKHLLYVSTDYVFDGTKDVYREDDEPHPLGWYAVTKYEGERRVGTLGPFGLTIRIANPYKRRDLKKLDFVHKIVDRLKNGQSVRAPRDQIFVPTLVDDVARAIDVLVGRSASGVYHVVGSQALSPYDAARRIATTYGFDASRIMPTTFDEYFRGMAPRPFHGRLINDKIARFGVKMSTFDEGLRRIYEEDSVGESL
ncbi:hypothetical protein A2973_05085 [Candidatus Gottesmanbacteria bacterium RIFCSPLOWO2_01_FULL_49_10]|uniref:dTDP-4-dehydrorhamnose reductase n=1 Tax=Candidatus Gottesmanbacteria bacterium RIFCSPLOWO2_01_FULL_49_10 TaxID=1798396 RepID=A0A1F6AZS1_9BACT|nr:MAG: dTDP-4-dehydrorhamnose reductase [Microgenomates group bacterium GW2011_GWA2_47_8]OGG29992.1 MAG: hypothetical protein A2973_05085 [Candidatus Gottesmanbacteria bacterium RIFCSPLOWO2_01_FULL_49_10]